MKTSNVLAGILISLSLVSCSSTSKNRHVELQKLVRENKFKDGLALVKEKSFYGDTESHLLKLMELGMLHSLNGNHFQALQKFDMAQDLSDRLFTVSISKKALSAVANDNLDNYYGEKYERSMIRFYQALQHFYLSQSDKYESYLVSNINKDGKVIVENVEEKALTDKDRRFHLNAARSVLIEWNSLLDNYKSTSRGEPVYKDDLLAKVFGAFIHEQLGSSEDRQIANSLYIAAKKVLIQNFGIYKTYNVKGDDFEKNFDKLSSMPMSKVKSKYLLETKYYKDLISFIDERLRRLKSRKQDNVYFLISNGFIAPKIAKKFNYPLPLDSVQVAARGNFVSFTGEVLSVSNGTMPSIYFELPVIPFELSREQNFIVINDEAGKEVLRKETALVNPLSEVAYKALEDSSSSQMTKVGVRVAAKHLAALTAAYTLYNTQKDQFGRVVAMMAASGSYAIANKLIARSEGADLRFWSTLPSDYRITSLSLKKGMYTAKVISVVDGKEEVKGEKPFEVSNKRSLFIPITSI